MVAWLEQLVTFIMHEAGGCTTCVCVDCGQRWTVKVKSGGATDPPPFLTDTPGKAGTKVPTLTVLEVDPSRTIAHLDANRKIWKNTDWLPVQGGKWIEVGYTEIVSGARRSIASSRPTST
jgi:hypothetical protein